MVFHQRLVRIRAGTKVDRGGNTVEDWSPGAVSRLEIRGFSVQPTSQTEEADATRTAVVSGWQAISAPGVDADIRSSDRVEWNAMQLEIVGEVARYPNFTDNSTHHIEFVMRRSTG